MINILNSVFDERTRQTIVDIQTPEGVFRGIAKAAPNEKLNDEIGETIGFWRAYIKYLKFLNRQNKAILKELQYMYDHSRKFDPTARKLKARIVHYRLIVLKLKEEIENYEATVETFKDIIGGINE